MRKISQSFRVAYYVLCLLFVGYTVEVTAQETSLTISAEVLLKSQSGRPVIQSDVPITTENIKTFTPSAQTIQEAKQRFQTLGFSVPIASTTLTVMGKPIQFEEVFKIKLNLQFNRSSNSIVAYPSSEPIIPDSLKDLVEALVFPKPIDLMK